MKGPDFVLEVVSRSTWAVDRNEKPKSVCLEVGRGGVLAVRPDGGARWAAAAGDDGWSEAGTGTCRRWRRGSVCGSCTVRCWGWMWEWTRTVRYVITIRRPEGRFRAMRWNAPPGRRRTDHWRGRRPPPSRSPRRGLRSFRRCCGSCRARNALCPGMVRSDEPVRGRDQLPGEIGGPATSGAAGGAPAYRWGRTPSDPAPSPATVEPARGTPPSRGGSARENGSRSAG